ncbi:hypothetical protein GCM10009687_49850 [Asanoa iriomotensis]|uniref:Uncharacterized protein n=1 Tax=Asanoa iriomotensis TaxID=234613 RepID=A0ABQ4BWA8_9ACTN|nr:hypothetical protein Air01nite_09020 [Asanoa iriomotensis]
MRQHDEAEAADPVDRDPGGQQAVDHHERAVGQGVQHRAERGTDRDRVLTHRPTQRRQTVEDPSVVRVPTAGERRVVDVVWHDDLYEARRRKVHSDRS